MKTGEVCVKGVRVPNHYWNPNSHYRKIKMRLSMN